MPGPIRARPLRLLAHARQDPKEPLDRARVERLAGFLLDQRDGRIDGHRLVVWTRRGQRAEVIDEAEDPGAQGDVFAFQAGRIAAAVPALVVTQDERGDRIGKRYGRDDVGTDLRMGLDLLEFLRRERSRLCEDVVRHRELADVVEECSRLHGLDLDLGHAHLPRHGGRINLHAADVVLRRAVFGVDRTRKRLDRGQMQLGYLLDVPALVVEPRQKDKVRAQP